MKTKDLAKEIAGRAIDSDEPFLFVGDHSGKGVIMITGDADRLKSSLASAMENTPQLAEIFTDAVMVHKLKKLLDDFEPDCDSCPKKDDCPIRGGIETMAQHSGSCDAAKDLINKHKSEGKN